MSSHSSGAAASAIAYRTRRPTGLAPFMKFVQITGDRFTDIGRQYALDDARARRGGLNRLAPAGGVIAYLASGSREVPQDTRSECQSSRLDAREPAGVRLGGGGDAVWAWTVGLTPSKGCWRTRRAPATALDAAC